MINLRYHIVSLVAVFLAVGIGIVMGTTVVDRVTVDALNRRLGTVERSVTGVREENRGLRDQVRVGTDFAAEARDYVLSGHLQGVPVLVVAVAGVDRAVVDTLRGAVTGSGAAMEGTVWFTPRMRLEREEDRRALGALNDSRVGTPVAPAPDVAPDDSAPSTTVMPTPSTTAPEASADDVRTSALRHFAEPGFLSALVTGGFAVYEPPPGAPVPLALEALPVGGTRFALVSGAGAEVGDEVLAIPLAQVLSEGGPRVVAVEAGADSPGGRGVFVGQLRADPVVGAKVSTVDNLESPMGQAAAVLAMEQLALPRLGHFGVGPGAQRLLPQPAPSLAPTTVPSAAP